MRVRESWEKKAIMATLVSLVGTASDAHSRVSFGPHEIRTDCSPFSRRKSSADPGSPNHPSLWARGVGSCAQCTGARQHQSRRVTAMLSRDKQHHPCTTRMPHLCRTSQWYPEQLDSPVGDDVLLLAPGARGDDDPPLECNAAHGLDRACVAHRACKHHDHVCVDGRRGISGPLRDQERAAPTYAARHAAILASPISWLPGLRLLLCCRLHGTGIATEGRHPAWRARGMHRGTLGTPPGRAGDARDPPGPTAVGAGVGCAGASHARAELEPAAARNRSRMEKPPSGVSTGSRLGPHRLQCNASTK